MYGMISNKQLLKKFPISPIIIVPASVNQAVTQSGKLLIRHLMLVRQSQNLVRY